MKFIYYYLIVYSAHKEIDGFNQSINGMVDVTRTAKINSMDEVVSVKEFLEKKYDMKDLVVTNYKLLKREIGRWKD